MADLNALETLITKRGFDDFRWIDPRDIVVAHWVRLKCSYGCRHYGRNASCPPNVPSVDECRQLFGEYRIAAVLHFQRAFENPDDRHAWIREANEKLLQLERDVFLSGHQKAFLLFMGTCSLCAECTPSRPECHNPKDARPTPEGLGIDVYSTVRKLGYPIQVLSDYTQTMNRYAFLLIE